MDEFKNTLLHDQIAKLVGNQTKTPFEKAQEFFSKRGWLLRSDGKLVMAVTVVVGEVVDLRVCEEGHVHVRVKMLYEFVIPEDANELKGSRD